MAYKSEYYERAITAIKDAKKLREKEYEYKLAELYAAVPELTVIENRLAAIGAESMSAAMGGNKARLDELAIETKTLASQKNEILKSAKLKAPTPACKLCGDTGYNGTQLCECARQKARELVFNDLSEQLPLEAQPFDSFSLDYYEGAAKKQMTAVYKFVKKYAEGFSRRSESLLFTGGVGLGKTHLSMAVINEVTKAGYGVVYGSAQNLFSKIEKEHFSFSGESDKIDAVLECDLLVIDDLGTEFLSSFIVSQFYNIINTRITSGKPTIINTNLSPAEIEERYTPRVLSRIVGNYKALKFDGTDNRLKKQ